MATTTNGGVYASLSSSPSSGSSSWKSSLCLESLGYSCSSSTTKSSHARSKCCCTDGPNGTSSTSSCGSGRRSKCSSASRDSRKCSCCNDTARVDITSQTMNKD